MRTGGSSTNCMKDHHLGTVLELDGCFHVWGKFRGKSIEGKRERSEKKGGKKKRGSCFLRFGFKILH